MPRSIPVQERAQLQRNHILSASRQLIENVNIGPLHFTTDQVAALAGTSIGTVYRYFDDKLDILFTLYPDARVELGAINLDAPSVIGERDPNI